VSGNHVCIFISDSDRDSVYIVPEEVMDLYPRNVIVNASLNENEEYLSEYKKYLTTVSIINRDYDKKFSSAVPITEFYTFFIY
jgi:hypothetical protein